jgi:hypothetical protein
MVSKVEFNRAFPRDRNEDSGHGSVLEGSEKIVGGSRRKIYDPDDANDEPFNDLAAETKEATNTPPALQVGPRVLNRFYKLIVDSQDKLFLVREHHYWRLASVDLDETGPAVAKSMGIYRVRWYIPEPNNTKTLSPIQCQYWPG